MTFLIAPFKALARWPVESQLQSRRNAMIALSDLAQRRAEIREVEEFLASRAGTHEPKMTGQEATASTAHA
jgi:hypothetical protein